MVFSPWQLDEFLEGTGYSDSRKKKLRNSVAHNIEWLDRFHKPISQWFKKFYPFNEVKPNLLKPLPRMSSRSPRQTRIQLIP